MMKAHGGRRVEPLPPDWKRVRRVVLERDRFRCAIDRCPRRANEVDHIVAAADGGDDSLDNLQSLCTPHHAQKTGREAARARMRSRSRFRPIERHPGTIDR